MIDRIPDMRVVCSILQVVMRDGQTVEEGEAIADDLMHKLGVNRDQLIAGAYMDLILNKQ